MAAATSSANPLALMGNGDMVLEILGSTTDEKENTIPPQNQKNTTHHIGRGVPRERTSVKQVNCLKSIPHVLLFIAIGIAAAVMVLPLIPFYTGAREVTVFAHEPAWSMTAYVH